MSILEKVKRGKVAKPRRICVYGSHGVGKTTWASRFPDALVIATEDGSGDIDVARLSVDTALESVTYLCIIKCCHTEVIFAS